VSSNPPALPGVEHVYSGKVRDLYRYPDGRLLVVASDRISAFDWVLQTPIPDKGKVLTALSLWWFEQLADVVPHHLVSLDVPPEVVGRAMVVQPLTMFPIECVARGFLAGSGLLEYQASGSVCGVALPAGLVEGSRLDVPIYTPASKAELGEHDENISYEQTVDRIGEAPAANLRDLTLRLYARARDIATERGIIVADTKFEFGLDAHQRVVLADEVLTPDSSRFWPADQWQPGAPQPSFDKQFVRDWLTSAESGWDRHGGQPPPPLPDDIVAATRARYLEAYERLTGKVWG